MTDLAEIVRRVLEQCPQTRNSDTLLFLKVLEAVCEQNGMDLRKLTVAEFERYGSMFPNIQIIKRVRRQITPD